MIVSGEILELLLADSPAGVRPVSKFSNTKSVKKKK